MQNILEILKELGIEVPKEKSASLTKKVSENYKTIAEHDLKVSALEADRDKYKGDAETAAATLKDLDGKTPEEIIKDRDEWKRKAEESKNTYEKQIADRDYADAVEKATAGLKFTSNAAKRQFMADIMVDQLKLKDGKIMGFDDYVKDYKEKDATALADEKQQELETNKAKFTDPKKGAGGSELTKDQIMQLKDPSERQKAIRENIGLFQKGE